MMFIFIILAVLIFILMSNETSDIFKPELIKTNYINNTDPFKKQVSYPSFLINKTYVGDIIVDNNGNRLVINTDEKDYLNELNTQLKNQYIEFKTPNTQNELEVITHNNKEIEDNVITPISSTFNTFIGKTNGKIIDITYIDNNIFIRNGEIIMKYKLKTF